VTVPEPGLFNREVPMLNGTRSAVVVVDVQNDFCHPDGIFSRAMGMRLEDPGGLVERINELTGAARRNEADVLWLRMIWDGDEEVGVLARGGFLAHEGLRAGTWGVELVDGVDVGDGDVFIAKKRFSGFFRTELEDILRARNVGRLYLAGVRTDYCVESTVRDAFFRDYDIVVVRDCVAGYFPQLHESSLTEMGTLFARIVGVDDAVAMLGSPVAATGGAGTGTRDG